MSDNQSLKEELIRHLISSYESGQKWKEIGEKFGFQAEQARKIWLNYRKKNSHLFGIDGKLIGKLSELYYKTGSKDLYKIVTDPDTKVDSKNDGKLTLTLNKITELKEDVKTGEAEIKIEGPNEIKDLKDLEKLIDTSKWEVTKYIQNYWNGKYQVKAWLQPLRAKESEIIKEILNKYKSGHKVVPQTGKIINKVWDEDSLLLINLPDLHLDKRDMEDTSIDDNIKNYFEVLNHLVSKAYHSAKIEQIVFVVGNDVFNTDTFYGTTTDGTPQRCITTWNEAYEKIFKAMVDSITLLSTFCKNVHVVLVQGNHDRTKSYYMTHALEAYFKYDNSITFDRSIKINKAVIYGNSFIGLNHGDNINDKLPLAFAQEFYKAWGECKYHDIYIGDKHHNNEKVFNKKQMQNDGNQGVKLRILPSLSKPDSWHDNKLFRSRQSGIAILYDKDRGKSAEFEFQL